MQPRDRSNNMGDTSIFEPVQFGHPSSKENWSEGHKFEMYLSCLILFNH